MRERFIIPLLTLFLISTGCHSSHEEHKDHDHDGKNSSEIDSHIGEDHEEHNSDEIILSEAKAKAAGVKVEKIVPKEFSDIIKCSGKILPSSGDESTVVSPVAGILTMSKSFTEGMEVGKGTSLFTVSTSGLPEGDYYRRLKIAFDKAREDYERARKLIADKLITDKEYLEAKTEYERAELSLNSIAATDSSKGVMIKSPVSGYINQCLVSSGDYVEVGQPLMRISQNKSLFLRAEVSERDYLKIPEIKSARFRPAYSDKIYDLSVMHGRPVSSGSNLVTNGSFIPLTFEFDNTGGILPGCFAEIYLSTGTRSGVIAVPVSALTEEQGVYFVYVRVDEDGYVKREVKRGGFDGEYVEIVSGLEPGEDIVSEGAVHVKLASASNSIPAHSHNH